jgi:hypothetical protein
MTPFESNRAKRYYNSRVSVVKQSKEGGENHVSLDQQDKSSFLTMDHPNITEFRVPPNAYRSGSVSMAAVFQVPAGTILT